MRLSRLSLTAACLLGTLSAAERVQFNRDIRPIFSDTCFACHGPDESKNKGKLRLDTLEAARKGGKSGDPAIVPGKPEQSSVMKRLLTTDPDDHMPPAEFHKVLTAAQVDTVRRWIAAGELAATRQGCHHSVTHADLHAYLEGRHSMASGDA